MELILCLIEFNQFLAIVKKQLLNSEEILKALATSSDLNDVSIEMPTSLSTRVSVASTTATHSMPMTLNRIHTRSFSGVFYSKTDQILFDKSFNNVKKIKIYDIAKSVPNSFIIQNNGLNLKRYKSKKRISKYSCNRPALLVSNEPEINMLLLQLALFYCIAFEFYHKYVKVGSEFEINIPFFLKQKYYDYFDTFNFIQFINNENFQSSNSANNNEIGQKVENLINDIKFEMQLQSKMGIIDYINTNNDNNNTFADDASMYDENEYVDDLDFLVNPSLYEDAGDNQTDHENEKIHNNPNDTGDPNTQATQMQTRTEEETKENNMKIEHKSMPTLDSVKNLTLNVNSNDLDAALLGRSSDNEQDSPIPQRNNSNLSKGGQIILSNDEVVLNTPSSDGFDAVLNLETIPHTASNRSTNDVPSQSNNNNNNIDNKSKPNSGFSGSASTHVSIVSQSALNMQTQLNNVSTTSEKGSVNNNVSNLNDANSNVSAHRRVGSKRHSEISIAASQRDLILSDMIDPKSTRGSLLHEISMNELEWLLFKIVTEDEDDESIIEKRERIVLQLKKNLYTFLFVLSKMLRKTNFELMALLENSFQRLDFSSYED